MLSTLGHEFITRSSFYVITCFPEQLPVWRIGTRGGSGAISDALQIQVIFDEIIKIAISVTIIAHIVLLVVLHYKKAYGASAELISSNDHKFLHAKYCVNWLCKSSFTTYGK